MKRLYEVQFSYLGEEVITFNDAPSKRWRRNGSHYIVCDGIQDAIKYVEAKYEEGRVHQVVTRTREGSEVVIL